MSQDYINHLDLPKPLMMMLGTLKSQYDIKNWSIYSNNNQNTCVVIRFDDMHGCTQPIQYKRISEKQHARSKARSELYKQNKNKDIAPDTNQVKKRKCDQLLSSPETLRMETDNSYIRHIDSPDMLDMPRVDEVDQFKWDHHTNTTSDFQMTKASSDCSDTVPTADTIHPGSIVCSDQDAVFINSTPKSNSEPIPTDFPSAVQTSYTLIGTVPILNSSTPLTTSSQTTPYDYPEHSIADETMLCCPCCNEKLTASHQCEILNIGDVSSDSIIHKPDDNQICTPTPDHNHPPSTPPPHSLKPPTPEPPDGNTSSKTNELNINKILWAFSALLDDKCSKPK